MDSLEKNWCERALRGDAEAASNLISAHYESVFGYFRRLCGNPEDASDLTQKTFCKFWNSINSFQARSSLKTWLFGIAYHTYVDWVRSIRRAPLPDRWWEDDAMPVRWPDQTLQMKESAESVLSAVEKLDPGDRQLIHLHFYEGLSVQDTSEIVQAPLSTVKYRLSSALEKLYAALRQERSTYEAR